MRILQYNIVLFFVFTVFGLNAQKKKHKEEFNVKSDVVININTRHSDIEIETWNKNKVVVEAYMLIEGEEFSKEEFNKFYQKWDFEAKGNSQEITIKSRTNSDINIYSFDFDDINYDDFVFPLADFSIGSLDVLDSIDFIVPPLPPEVPRFLEMSIPALPSEFDYEAYKKDKSYLENWKKENKEVLGENAKIKIDNNTIFIKTNNRIITMDEWKEKQDIKEEVYEKIKKKIHNKEIAKEIIRHSKERKKHAEERKKAIIEMKKNLKKQIKNQKGKRIEIQKMLKKRSKLKVKRIIKIKAPKSAKLNMNVKYGELSFTK